MERKYYRVQVDEENSAEKWWANGGRELWEEVISEVDSYGKATYKSKDGKMAFFEGKENLDYFIKKAEEIPGWESDCKYAPNPFVINEDELIEAYQLYNHEWLEESEEYDSSVNLLILDSCYGLYSDEVDGLSIINQSEWRIWEREWEFRKIDIK